ncbi:endodeoxyribonuclease [Podila horticola]|nr:endodeoxyribonuclease [Podila horticola]
MDPCSSAALYSDGYDLGSDSWEQDLALPLKYPQHNIFGDTDLKLGSDCSYYSSDGIEGDCQPTMYKCDVSWQETASPSSIGEQHVPQIDSPPFRSDELDDNPLYQPDIPRSGPLYQLNWSSDLDSIHENDWLMPIFDSDPDFTEEVRQETVQQTVCDDPNDTNTAPDLSLDDQGLIGSHDMHSQAMDSGSSVEEQGHSRKKLKISHYPQTEIPILVPPFTPVRSPPSPLPPASPPLSYTSHCQKLLEDQQEHFSRTVPRSREWLMEKQEGMLADLLSTVCEGEPKLSLVARVNRHCIVYDEEQGVIRRKADMARSGTSKDPSRKTISFKKKSWHVAASVIRAVDLVHDNLSRDMVSTKRDIFYRDIPTFRRQARIDSIVEDLACTFQTPRSCLKVVAASRSVVYGSIRFTLRVSRHTLDSMDVEASEASIASNDRANRAGRGGGVSYTDFNTMVSVPVIESEVLRIEIHPETRYVLVIEKEATLTHLISAGFCESHGPCILLTSKGYPDRVSRLLLRRISDMVKDRVYFLDHPFDLDLPFLTTPCFSSVPLHIPLLAVIDCDPNGIDIYLTYRCGSVKSAYDNENLAVSTLQLLGQLPSDWTMFFRSSSIADLSDDQDQDGKDSKQREYLQHQFSRSLLPLTRRDRSLLLKRLTQHPFVKANKTIKAEISRMLRMNCKSEMQSLYLDDPWAKHHAWRQHALFTRSARIRTMFPGLGIASVAFAAYLGYEYVTAPKDAHHGEGHH